MATQVKNAGPSPYDTYQTSLTARYCSPEMSRLFGQRSRHSQWRRLWLLLAESEKELGIDTITPEALEQMKQHLEVTDQDFEVARVEEKIRRHDVMAHVHAFGAVAPAAAGIIHYGATSCFVTDNAELILMRDAMDLLLPRLAKVISNLCKLAREWKATPALAYTHLQPAQLITVGKRAAQWAQDLVFDLESIEHVRNGLLLRGAQGTTGTQASFLEIFGGDGSKCDQLNELLCKKIGFPACYDVSTQTYTRKVDLIVANAICGLGATAQKIAGDIRHLASWQEAEEPFEDKQVGSSAMPFKRNPMRSERISSLARELLSKQATTANTLAAQWMERSLDDSAVRRMDLPEMFLLADAIIGSLDNVTDGMVIYPQVIASRVQQQLPFMCAENIIMKLCAKGISRQEAHEQIRVLSHQAARVVKLEGKSNDLIDRIKASEFFQPIWADLDDMLRPELYIGRSVDIVERYCGLEGVAEKKIQPYRAIFEKSATTELNV
ncbi:adenylosuccinate lyase [Colletotrichum graminicola M1.001]|uniref:Adenylosuccinate lyase n=1 Tax=Colletotrichum graminicola (strain M1.001 / M2 / FGSC 10212) TaxID=645133 RepID=E3QJN8_COLGM|nr:adenylosuccinate lyase [Colletotrichum graminicola M1.001]EFQ31076.1 adenylosuccinate lyase [Colletotrichum graminicola M1.001]